MLIILILQEGIRISLASEDKTIWLARSPVKPHPAHLPVFLSADEEERQREITISWHSPTTLALQTSITLEPIFLNSKELPLWVLAKMLLNTNQITNNNGLNSNHPHRP